MHLTLLLCVQHNQDRKRPKSVAGAAVCPEHTRIEESKKIMCAATTHATKHTYTATVRVDGAGSPTVQWEVQGGSPEGTLAWATHSSLAPTDTGTVQWKVQGAVSSTQ